MPRRASRINTAIRYVRYLTFAHGVDLNIHVSNTTHCVIAVQLYGKVRRDIAHKQHGFAGGRTVPTIIATTRTRRNQYWKGKTIGSKLYARRNECCESELRVPTHSGVREMCRFETVAYGLSTYFCFNTDPVAAENEMAKTL